MPEIDIEFYRGKDEEAFLTAWEEQYGSLTDEEIDTIETELLAEPQYQRQYQWSPLSAVEQQQPEGGGDISNEVPGEGNPVPGPDNGA